MAAKTYRELWRRNHPVHHSHLFLVLSFEVAFVEVDEKGAEAGAADEGVAGKD
jgi:hypothetical protein